MPKEKQPPDELPEPEIAERMGRAIKRMMETPKKPKQAPKPKMAKRPKAARESG